MPTLTMPTVKCPECFRTITLTSIPQEPHFTLVCPHCQIRVTATFQPPTGPSERKKYDMCTPAGRFLGEYDPAHMTVTIPYRGTDYEFDLRRTSTWPQRLQSE